MVRSIWTPYASGHRKTDVEFFRLAATHLTSVSLIPMRPFERRYGDPHRSYSCARRSSSSSWCTIPLAMAVVLTPELLGRFEAGAALLRATARGRPQWLREPPPEAREIAVELQRQPKL